MVACSDWTEGRGEVCYAHPSITEAPPCFAFSLFCLLLVLFAGGEAISGGDGEGGVRVGNDAAGAATIDVTRAGAFGAAVVALPRL
jgi:hypothetical protein